MNYRKSPLTAGLYLVSTPIGSARDITLRALDVLASADMLVAEDTRTLRKLMELHGVPLEGRRVMAYHDHSGEAARVRVAEAILSGQSVAYASEAGTPLIADPGFALAREVQAKGGAVTAAPGPCAAIAALSIAGLATDQFHFAGFLPNATTARKSILSNLRAIPATLVFYEAPGRVGAMLTDAKEVLGSARDAALCRELTKRFEETRRGTLSELVESVTEHPPKGECVVLIARATEVGVTDEEIDAALNEALSNMRVKDAATTVAGSFNLPRRDVYQRALALQKSSKGGT